MSPSAGPTPMRRDLLLEVEGTQLAVTHWGHDTGLAPVIVHHGAPGIVTGAQSLEAFGFLSSSRLVVTYDAAGSGASHPPAPGVSLGRWVNDLEAVRTTIDGRRCVIAGISYGGFVALQHAVSTPALPVGLILSGTSARGGLTERALQEVGSRERRFDVDRVLRFLEGRVHDADDLRGCLDELQPLYAVPGAQATSRGSSPAEVLDVATHNYAMSVGQHQHDVLDRLARITVPTLVTVGRHDWITPVSDSQQLVERLPLGTLEVFEESGHSPYRDEPGAFADVVSRFLSRHVDDLPADDL